MSSAPRWPDRPALFLDLDGTLLGFALDPSRVKIPERLGPILGELPRATGGALAFVSGRTLADIDRLLGKGRFPVAAVHGLERRNARGELLAATRDSDDFTWLNEDLEQLAAEFPGVSIEHKGITLAVHYRRCPENEAKLIDRVESILTGHASELKLMRGKMVLEIKPAEADKGTAIAAFMREEPFRGRTPVFVGDDVTDEDGFRVVNELGGVSVKVDEGPTGASFRLADTAAVIDWLEQLVVRR